MRILVDGEVFAEREESGFLEDILNEVQSSDLCSERVIVDVLLNGEKVEDFGVEVGKDDEVEVRTEDKKRVVEDIFDDFLERVESGEIADLLKVSADLFRADRGAEAWERLDSLWTLLRGVIIGVDSCVGYATEKEEVDGAREKLQSLNIAMQELSESVECGDYVMVADSLEYELPERMEELKEVVAVMKKWLR